MILSKDHLVFLIFLLGATLFGWGGIQTKMTYDLAEDAAVIADTIVACGDLDARVMRLEKTHVQRK